MTCSVTIKKRALKSLETIAEPNHSRIRKELNRLGNNPRRAGYVKLKGRPGYRIRVADYRIIDEIMDRILVVDVIEIGHRKEVYE